MVDTEREGEKEGGRAGRREGEREEGPNRACIPFPLPSSHPVKMRFILDVNLHSAVVVPDNSPQRNGMSSKGHQKQLVFVDQLLFNKLLDNNNKSEIYLVIYLPESFLPGFHSQHCH